MSWKKSFVKLFSIYVFFFRYFILNRIVTRFFSCQKTLLNITHDRKSFPIILHTVLQSFMITATVRLQSLMIKIVYNKDEMINSLLQQLSKRDNIVVQCNYKKVPSNSKVIPHSVSNSSNGLNSTNMTVNTNNVSDITIVHSPRKII